MKIPLLERVVIGCLGGVEVVDCVGGIAKGESLSWTGSTVGTTMSLDLGEGKASGNVTEGMTSLIGETCEEGSGGIEGVKSC